MTSQLAPSGAAFYVPPAPLPDGEHGDPIWAAELAGVAAFAEAATNERVLYRSENVHGEPIVVSGIIALPKHPAPGNPVVSWAHGTVGAADLAAPSRDTVDGPAHQVNVEPHGLVNDLLRAGYAVVATDYEGLGTPGNHPYLVGESEARSVLDIVRAARILHPELSGNVAVLGHSQGGHAAIFAAHHAPKWTPELRLVGVTAYAPGASVADGFRLIPQSPITHEVIGFFPLFLIGAVAADPSIDLRALLTDRAYELYQRDIPTRSRFGLSEEESFGGILGTDLLKPEAIDGPDYQKVLAVLEANNPVVTSEVGLRVVQGLDDPRVLAVTTSALVDQLTELNGSENVEYVTYETVADNPISPHFGVLTTDTPATLAWLAAEFAKG
ncbi:alpha/beta fold hydrolase [Nocardia camponoti]|uniref:Lipase n=1 Tax=Nocardia camponoti TaxID=1616106 RepID=A0A917QMB6_9NOCA|nr:alpha/beta fold hydrolase [Nocardia camponoti]GGK58859.1 lipase [Nocardia camponoti]